MVPKSRFQVSERSETGRAMWPVTSGQNLDRVELEFPRDFTKEFNLVFVPFLQQQQLVVNTWVPAGDQLERERSDFAYYEFPTISRFPGFARTFINEGMRSGIPDPAARARTVTLYIDVATFRKDLDIPDRNDVHVFLVNRSGEILWRTSGSYSEEKGRALIEALG